MEGLAILLIVALWPLSAYAHLHWMAGQKQAIASRRQPPSWLPPVLVTGCAVCIVLALLPAGGDARLLFATGAVYPGMALALLLLHRRARPRR